VLCEFHARTTRSKTRSLPSTRSEHVGKEIIYRTATPDIASEMYRELKSTPSVLNNKYWLVVVQNLQLVFSRTSFLDLMVWRLP